MPRPVDPGCGEGRDVIEFAGDGHEAVGADISEPGLIKAEA